ncbi:MAG: hypothetical protein S4CHLAM6_09710 [Chlamydiae bacterium]|nr:hypothetical protein [Chlamydiota bacterium]
MFAPGTEVTVSEKARFLMGSLFNFGKLNTSAFTSVFVAFIVVF